VIKAADMMIARRADTQARADVATWKMMAKLNGTASLSAEAQAYLADYQALLGDVPETDATDRIIDRVYRDYYAAMGGAGTAPEIQSAPVEPVSNNVTPFKRPKKPRTAVPRTGPATSSTPSTKRPLPVALIFIGMVIVVVGVKYLFR
jgi:hypothetical protein